MTRELTQHFASRLAERKKRPVSALNRRPSAVQVTSLMDGTASMTKFLKLVRDKFKDLMAALAREHERLQMAAGVYRDLDCRTPFAFFGGTSTPRFARRDELADVQAFLDNNSDAQANDTYIEQMAAGLYRSAMLPWTAPHRLIVHVGDNASKGFTGNPELCEFQLTTDQVIEALRNRRIRTYMVQCGNCPSAKEEYQQIARATGGRYVPFDSLTDLKDLLMVIQAAVAHASGKPVQALLDQAREQGQLQHKSTIALLEHFGDSSS